MNGLWRWGMALALLTTGCVSTPLSRQRVARYRPDEGDRKPWQWSKESAGQTVEPAGADARPAAKEPAGDAESLGGKNLKPSKILSRGDMMMIYLRGIFIPEDLKNVVDENGRINLPLIGTVVVQGKTSSEAERLIEKAYIEGGYYNKINVIIVAQEDEYFVRGEVKKENRYPLAGDLTLLQAITAAGGYTDFAKRNQVRIVRGEQVLVYDAEKIEQRREQDPLLKPGDVVVVPRKMF